MAWVLNHREKAPLNVSPKPEVDFTWVVFESRPTLKIEGLWPCRVRDCFPPAWGPGHMGFAEVAVSLVLDAAAPPPPLRSHPVLVQAGTEKSIHLPIWEMVQNLRKVILKYLKICIDFLNQYFRIFEFQSSHTSALCFIPISLHL